MKNTFNIILTVCMVVIAYSMVSLNMKIDNYTKEYNETYEAYKELVQQYDSTTTYNKMVIYRKIKYMEEKLK